MKTIKGVFTILILTLFIVPFCQSQNIQYRSKIRPNVKAKLDSLYPNATSEIVLNDQYVSDTTQEISINCNCSETKGVIVLQFDTNANLLNKSLNFNSLKSLPDTITSYIKKNTSSNISFDNLMCKSISNKGDTIYGIIMRQNRTANGNVISTFYDLRFKSTGELISKEKEEAGGI